MARPRTPLSRLAAVLGGLLASRGGRRLAARHAGKLALATLAWDLYRRHRARGAPTTSGETTRRDRPPHARRRWSGRSV